MYYEVYIDQLFLENLILLLLLQRLGAVWLGKRISWIRIWLTALPGAAAMCAVIFFRPFGSWKGSLLRMLAVFPAAAGLGCASAREYLRAVTALLFSAVLMAGGMELLFSIGEPPVILAAVTAGMGLELLMRRQRNRRALEEYRAQVILRDQGDRWTLTGLIDTGNHLKEPMTGRPVSILDREEAKKLQRFCRIEEEDSGYLYIPYHSVGKEKGWMKGMVVDEMLIRTGEETFRITHPVLAVSEQKLSLQGEYQIILSPGHLQAGIYGPKARKK